MLTLALARLASSRGRERRSPPLLTPSKHRTFLALTTVKAWSLCAWIWVSPSAHGLKLCLMRRIPKAISPQTRRLCLRRCPCHRRRLCHTILRASVVGYSFLVVFGRRTRALSMEVMGGKDALPPSPHEEWLLPSPMRRRQRASPMSQSASSWRRSRRCKVPYGVLLGFVLCLALSLSLGRLHSRDPSLPSL